MRILSPITNDWSWSRRHFTPAVVSGAFEGRLMSRRRKNFEQLLFSGRSFRSRPPIISNKFSIPISTRANCAFLRAEVNRVQAKLWRVP
jgi:hypothetical protein